MASVIEFANSPADYAEFANLVRQYTHWCRARYSVEADFIDQVFGFQSLEAELQNLADAYGLPNGRTLLARNAGRVWGAVAYRRLSARICEMKRLYVIEAGAGKGIGRQLCMALISQAHADGYSLMRLDTGRRFDEALQLYHSLGFRPCAPYQDYPAHWLDKLVFLELALKDG